jgi:hypothetical protein
MKKLLTTIFMAVLTVSAFATVDLQTTSPNLSPSECSPIGAMKFVVTDPGDFLQSGSVGGILIKVVLKGEVSLHPVYIKNQVPGATDYTDPLWQNVVTDPGPGSTFTASPQVFYKTDCTPGYDYFFIWVPAGSIAPATAPNDEAWFQLSPNPADKSLATPILVSVAGLTLNENVVAVVEDFQLTAQPADPYTDTWNIVSSQVTSYQPSNPSVGIVRGTSSPTFTATEVCPLDKNDDPIPADPIYLCKTYSQDQLDVTCNDGYRYGTICDFDIDVSNARTGMFVTIEPADPDVYIVWDANGDSVPDFTVTSGDFTFGTAAACDTTAVDAQNGQNLSNANTTNCDGTDTVVASDSFVPGVVIAHKVQIPVSAISATSGTFTVSGLELARSTDMGPLATVGLNFGLTMEDCSTPCDSTVIAYNIPGDTRDFYRCCDCIADFGVQAVADVADFDACSDLLGTLVPDHEALYLTYFPKLNGSWWAGMAITNTSVLDSIAGVQGYPGSLVQAQTIHATVYFVEADGDVYSMDAGFIPAGGIFLTSITEGMAGVTTTSADTTFGDEQFWAIVVLDGEIPGTMLRADAFGMLGNGTEAQGFLGRLENWGWTGVNGQFNK